VTVREITVEEWEEGSNFYYAFEPRGKEPTVGFIIYPGGLVDPAAYAPAAHALAAQGYLTVIVKMKNDIALGQSAQRATRVINDYPGIEKWAIGGHSLGGVGATSYVRDFTDNIAGLVLWASYGAEAFRIDDKDLPVISIYGTKDGVSTVQEIEDAAEYLPPHTRWVPIAGGNHTQFGWYDTSPDPLQPDDNPADITREKQQAQIVHATAGFLDQFVERTLPSCPIVAIYGEDSDEVALLRRFRDNSLTSTAQGQELIELYYRWSPLILRSILEDGALKKDLKEMVDGVLPLVRGTGK
jgi:predicted alpha/beta-hydrolase family hydrolase